MPDTEPEKLKRQPEPTIEDELLLDRIVKTHLGEQATGEFFGAMSRGVRGDEGHYGHSVIIVDPDMSERFRRDPEGYPELLATMSTAITNEIRVAGNVVLGLAGQEFFTTEQA